VSAILNRIQPDAVGPGARFDVTETHNEHTSTAELFGRGLRSVTGSLSVLAFIILGALTVGATWTPTLLSSYGYTPSLGALIVAFNGFGSFFGTVSAGFLLERFGIRRVLAPALLGASAAFLAMGYGTFLFELIALASFCAGALLGVASSSILALAALIYPTAIRSTGTGFAMGMGRCGAVILPLLVGKQVQVGWNMPDIMSALGLLLAVGVPAVLVLARNRCAS
jgi:AAHS family 4-hydroxybenzoate transporter-like MFS transporter